MDVSRIAKAQGRLDLTGAPEGFDALVVADVARARKGVVLFIARDGARATAFESPFIFGRRSGTMSGKWRSDRTSSAWCWRAVRAGASTR